jgi:hypothetical protein
MLSGRRALGKVVESAPGRAVDQFAGDVRVAAGLLDHVGECPADAGSGAVRPRSRSIQEVLAIYEALERARTA